MVLDYNMPGMKGDQVAQIIRQEHPGIPIVLFPWGVPELLLRTVDAYVQKAEGPVGLSRCSSPYRKC